MARELVLAFLVVGCSSEVEPCLYERVETGVAAVHNVSIYAFCDGVDGALNGSCEGANVTVDRIEHINTGRGHQYCAFNGPAGAKATAKVVCQCP